MGREVCSPASTEIVEPKVRRSAITSHVIGVPELETLLAIVPPGAPLESYQAAVIADNVLGLKTESGRSWRYQTLRRLYFLRPDSLLFRALRDLWPDERQGRPLLAGLCALATDTVFRATTPQIINSSPGQESEPSEFADAIEVRYPGVYAESTMSTVARNAASSWQQTGHLGPIKHKKRTRTQAACKPANVAYAFLLGHLEGARGEALFDTLWAKVLDVPRSQLLDLAFAASQRGMLEFRSSGGVTEVGFKQLLRPMDG